MHEFQLTERVGEIIDILLDSKLPKDFPYPTLTIAQPSNIYKSQATETTLEYSLEDKKLYVSIKNSKPQSNIFFENGKQIMKSIEKEIKMNENLHESRTYSPYVTYSCLNNSQNIAIPFYPGLSLRDFAENIGYGNLLTTDIQLWLYEVAHAMEVIHNLNFFHGNITSFSVYIRDNFDIALGDFFFDFETLKNETTRSEGFFYKSPEILDKYSQKTHKYEINEIPFLQKCDVYSFGVLVNEFLSQEKPNAIFSNNKHSIEQIHRIVKHTTLFNDEFYPCRKFNSTSNHKINTDFIVLLNKMLLTENEKRPSFTKIREFLEKNPWHENVDMNKFHSRIKNFNSDHSCSMKTIGKFLDNARRKYNLKQFSSLTNIVENIASTFQYIIPISNFDDDFTYNPCNFFVSLIECNPYVLKNSEQSNSNTNNLANDEKMRFFEFSAKYQEKVYYRLQNNSLDDLFKSHKIPLSYRNQLKILIKNNPDINKEELIQKFKEFKYDLTKTIKFINKLKNESIKTDQITYLNFTQQKKDTISKAKTGNMTPLIVHYNGLDYHHAYLFLFNFLNSVNIVDKQIIEFKYNPQEAMPQFVNQIYPTTVKKILEEIISYLSIQIYEEKLEISGNKIVITLKAE
ncbi:hypothetical protein TRFO_39526 [Tritrichomonas foetus]|uniref:Protein kinase domain-containing protein n=1 Tax=Tritrichomonas foetus TaxID=1144522 RepID=A0A1J4JA09_9EUKA|nr:hypothetical protein TRFO_39526 [Tritrichomonas foetus]|eukprot:OHS94277.1 hypothetical protein TRFO_39526 [Tritrichomonas foetus]